MRRLSVISIVGAVFLAIFLPAFSGNTAESAQEDKQILYWTCGMHPSVKENEAGKCPICNMDLVPVFSEVEEDSAETVMNEEVQIRISSAAARLARVSTAEVTRRKLVKSIRAPAVIDYDETRNAVISARFGGRVEKLYADYVGIKIEKGDSLALVYSPELISAQKELLLASDPDLYASARRKLLLWGITESQIRELTKRGEIRETLLLHATASGTLIHTEIREGSYMKEGDPLFHISDISRVWAVADLFEDEMELVREGMKVRLEMESLPGESIEGSVSFIEPFVTNRPRSVKVRAEFDNRGGLLRPGMYATMNIDVPLNGSSRSSGGNGMDMDHSDHLTRTDKREDASVIKEHAHGGEAADMQSGVLSVPRSAVINTGTRTVAFVEKKEGIYLLRNLTLGRSAEGYYVILDGLEEGERVVEKGSFLIDSQSRLTGQAEEVYGGALGKESGSREHIH